MQEVLLGRRQVTESQVASMGPPVAPSYPASLPSPVGHQAGTCLQPHSTMSWSLG